MLPLFIFSFLVSLISCQISDIDYWYGTICPSLGFDANSEFCAIPCAFNSINDGGVKLEIQCDYFNLNIEQIVIENPDPNLVSFFNGGGSLHQDVGELASLSLLSLDNMGLTGEIPFSIWHLPSLINLDLSRNALEGTLPESCQAPLERLQLKFNLLEGTIPSSFISSLAYNGNLERLELQYNSLSGSVPSEIGLLSGLTHLSLSSNQLSGPLPLSLVLLVNLEKLILYSNYFEGELPSLTSASNLQQLVIHDNSLWGSLDVFSDPLPPLEECWLVSPSRCFDEALCPDTGGKCHHICGLGLDPYPEYNCFNCPFGEVPTSCFVDLLSYCDAACATTAAPTSSPTNAPVAPPTYADASLCLPSSANCQWAEQVLDFTEQFGTGSYSAAQVLGAPECTCNPCASCAQAWAITSASDGLHWVEVSFDSNALLYAEAVVVKEAVGPGAVSQIEVRLGSISAPLTLIFSGTPTLSNSQWTRIDFPGGRSQQQVYAVRVTLDTDRVSGYNQIDAIRLIGYPCPFGECEPTPAPPTITSAPTAMPTEQPTAVPTAQPTATPTAQPTAVPTAQPTAMPTPQPTATPTSQPTATPTPLSTPSPTTIAETPSPTTPGPTTPAPTSISQSSTVQTSSSETATSVDDKLSLSSSLSSSAVDSSDSPTESTSSFVPLSSSVSQSSSSFESSPLNTMINVVSEGNSMDLNGAASSSVVGIVAGVVLGLAFIGGVIAAFFCLVIRPRRHKKQEEAIAEASGEEGGTSMDSVNGGSGGGAPAEYEYATFRPAKKLPETLSDDATIVREKVIGEGNFGIVYKAKFGEETVAVKELKGDDEKALDELLAEADLLLSLPAHKNVVSILALIEDPVAIVLEFCDQALDTLIYKRPEEALLDEDIYAIALDSAAGLAHLHRCGIVHRDIAARNVLLSSNGASSRFGTAKITDFGLSQRLIQGEENTTVTTIGPVRWWPLELLLEQRYSQKSDTYSFAMLLVELLTRKLPYASCASPIQVYEKVKSGERPELPDSCPQHLATLIQACWASESKLRPTMKAVVRALKTRTPVIMKKQSSRSYQSSSSRSTRTTSTTGTGSEYDMPKKKKSGRKKAAALTKSALDNEYEAPPEKLKSKRVNDYDSVSPETSKRGKRGGKKKK